MITVVIPLYNKENSIARALDSVLAQTYQDFEVVVVDDGSTDNGAAIVKQYTDSRIRLISQANAGVSAARNRGIAEARGEYVAFLDADDEWFPEFLDEIVVLQKEYPACRAQATSYVNHYQGKDNVIRLKKLPFKGERGVLYNYFEVASCSHPPVCSICVCVERQLLLDVKGFPIGVKSGEDLLVWAHIALCTNFAYSKKPLARYDMTELSLNNIPNRFPDAVDIVGNELKKIMKKYPRLKGIRRYIALWHKMRSSMYMRLGYKRKSIIEAMKSVYFNPFNVKTYAYLVLNLLNRYKKVKKLC